MLIGMVYSYLPFMVLPLFATLDKLDRGPAGGRRRSRRKAAGRAFADRDVAALAAGRARRLCALVFIPAVGEFVIPDLLGGPTPS